MSPTDRGTYSKALVTDCSESADVVAGSLTSAGEAPPRSRMRRLWDLLPEFLSHPELAEEVFGPTTLLVHYGEESDLLMAAQGLQGHLTATIHGTPEDLGHAQQLIRVLETKVGPNRVQRISYRSGSEPCDGAWRPFSSDLRWPLHLRRIASDPALCPTGVLPDFPHTALPPELQPANPLKIMRMLNGTLTRG